MTLQEFKTILNKDRLNRFDREIYVYINANEPFNKIDEEIAEELGTTTRSVRDLHRYAIEDIKNNYIIFNITVDYMNNRVKELSSYKEIQLTKIRKARAKVDMITNRKRVAV